ncbi:quinolinate synthase NadA [Peribacillus deserti]|uniref:quinolinate synthase n=1 Tax=Peribacillus deserti TaxID=673318 RepID=A0A2N5M6X7_9BACI|nr:hypothetical protein CUU66_08780 [Peribacillus deserti]
MLITEENIEDLKILLWKGHCSVHENFTMQNIDQIRSKKKDMKIMVHPECSRDVVERSDYSGSALTFLIGSKTLSLEQSRVDSRNENEPCEPPCNNTYRQNDHIAKFQYMSMSYDE